MQGLGHFGSLNLVEMGFGLLNIVMVTDSLGFQLEFIYCIYDDFLGKVRTVQVSFYKFYLSIFAYVYERPCIVEYGLVIVQDMNDMNRFVTVEL